MAGCELSNTGGAFCFRVSVDSDWEDEASISLSSAFLQFGHFQSDPNKTSFISALLILRHLGWNHSGQKSQPIRWRGSGWRQIQYTEGDTSDSEGDTSDTEVDTSDAEGDTSDAKVDTSDTEFDRFDIEVNTSEIEVDASDTKVDTDS